MIAIIIVLDILHKNFNTTISNLFKVDDKSINQVQNILQSKKAKNINKQTI